MFNPVNSFLPWVEKSQLVAQVGFYSSTFFGVIFIMLTLFGMKNRFGSYTYLLATFSSCGIVFASFEFVLCPNVHSYNAGYLFYSTSRPFNFGKEAVTLCITVYTGVYASTISMLSLQFIYRYWAIFHHEKLRLFEGWWVLMWAVYCSYFGVQWALGIYFLDMADEFTTEYLKGPIKENYNLEIEDLAGVAVLMYASDGSLRIRNFLGLVNMSSIMSVQYIVIIYCAIMMYANMEEKLELVSSSKKRLHNQLFKTLVLQIITPSFCLFLPVLAIISLPLLDLKINLPTGVFICAITIYPAMDAIICMTVVTDYRNVTKKFLKRTVDRLIERLKKSHYEVTRTGTLGLNPHHHSMFVVSANRSSVF